MNDTRVDHIEETLTQLTAKVDGLSLQMVTKQDLETAMARAFEQTQGGFEDHRTFMELTVQNSVGALRKEMNERFTRVDRRFDGMDERFDRLEKLIKGRPVSPRRGPRRRT